MVRTSTGPAEKSKPAKGVAAKPTAEDRKMERALDLDDATWDRVEALAQSQQIEPAEVVRRAIVQAFGEGPITSAFNAG